VSVDSFGVLDDGPDIENANTVVVVGVVKGCFERVLGVPVVEQTNGDERSRSSRSETHHYGNSEFPRSEQRCMSPREQRYPDVTRRW
jgi:hypothetical protein